MKEARIYGKLFNVTNSQANANKTHQFQHCGIGNVYDIMSLILWGVLKMWIHENPHRLRRQYIGVVESHFVIKARLERNKPRNSASRYMCMETNIAKLTSLLFIPV